MVKLNPFHLFKKTAIYSIANKDFWNWTKYLWKTLTGNEKATDYEMGFLDYALILPALVNYFCSLHNKDFRGKDALISFSKKLSVLKHMIAAFFIIPLVAVSFMSYLAKERIRNKALLVILNVEILPVNQNSLSILDYRCEDDAVGYAEMKEMFYSPPYCENRMTLKNYLDQLDQSGQDDFEQKYVLHRLYLRESTTDQFAIFGLFLRPISCYDHLTSSSEPVAFIVPSRKIKNEIEAMERIDAFGFSQTSNKLTEYVKQENIFTSHEDRRCTTALLSILLCSKSTRSSLQTAINVLLPEIFKFSGMRLDTSLINKLYQHPVFRHKPNTKPWIKMQENDAQLDVMVVNSPSPV